MGIISACIELSQRIQERSRRLGMEPVNLDIKQAAQYFGISWRYLDEIKCKKLHPANNKLVRYLNHGKRVLFPAL
jgi:hypothetical protein